MEVLTGRVVLPCLPLFCLMPSPPAGHTCSKHFEGYPCCHRQWQHPGHCRFVHGYSRSFTIWFAANELDRGFVVVLQPQASGEAVARAV